MFRHIFRGWLIALIPSHYLVTWLLPWSLIGHPPHKLRCTANFVSKFPGRLLVVRRYSRISQSIGRNECPCRSANILCFPQNIIEHLCFITMLYFDSWSLICGVLLAPLVFQNKRLHSYFLKVMENLIRFQCGLSITAHWLWDYLHSIWRPVNAEYLATFRDCC